MHTFSIQKEEWDNNLINLILSHTIFATVSNGSGQDYELIEAGNIDKISYNSPKPATSLKSFFLPVKENVTSPISTGKQRIIIGVPNCDIEGLSLLDEIYLDNDFNDLKYKERRENTILISSDCFTLQEHCHCTTYGIKPFALRNADIALAMIGNTIVFRTISEKGGIFIRKLGGISNGADTNVLQAIEKNQKSIEAALKSLNKSLPDYKETGDLINLPEKDIWDKYSSHCVSCGACSAICPTCTCFLLIDKPGFEKVKQMDACQYPGFVRVAGGEDALYELHNRFKNRYLCKYVWKPQKFNALACTGCGRCIEACLGKISKNEIFMELTKQKVHA